MGIRVLRIFRGLYVKKKMKPYEKYHTASLKLLFKLVVSMLVINEELINKYLYTSKIPDPDLLIRTGGEMRVSNFLLWQIAYSEFIVLKEFWPEFDKDTLSRCIIEFNNRTRRWGK